jgi:GNAT superfamily N-acetyltransferase
MNATIRIAGTGDGDLAAITRIVNAVTPDDPTSIDEIHWSDRTYPGTVRLLAELAGRAVGVGTVGRIYIYPPEFDGLWATLAVVAEVRRQGIGSGLLAAISERTRAAGKGWLFLSVTDAHPEGIDFLTHRGFTEYERSKMARLDLVGLEPPPIDLPEGIRLTTLAEHPELVEGVREVAIDAFPDIPGGDEPMSVGDLDEFLARDVERPGIVKDAFMVAQEATTGRVTGYASLILQPGSRSVAWHDMTAVRRDWRGRGLAGALKRATVRWAIANGLEALETGNDVDNAPMRAVNARLGFRPLPDFLVMRGRPIGGIMEA